MMGNFIKRLRHRLTRKRTLGEYSLLVISVLISLWILELFLLFINYPYLGCQEGAKIPNEGEFGHFDKQAGWGYNSSVSYYRGNLSYHFNEEGIRVDFPQEGIDFSRPRILFIGCSITFGQELEYKDTFAAKIGRLLGGKFEIVNLGVQGYGTDQSLVRLQQYINRIKPSVVVYTFIPDHINRNINHDRRQHSECSSFPGTKPLFGIKKDALVQKRKPVEIYQYDQLKMRLVLRHTFDQLREKISRKTKEDEKLTEKLIQEIENVSRKAGAINYHIYYDNHYDLFDNWNDRFVKEFFEDQGLKVLPFLNFTSDPEGDYYVPSSDYHPNSKLTTMIAEAFVKKFGQEILQIIKPEKLPGVGRESFPI